MSKADSLHPQRGIALLEVLVAFLILAVSLGVILQSTGASARQQRIVEDRAIAAAHAHNLLSRIGIDIPLADGEQTGSVNRRFDWRLRVTPAKTTGRYGFKRAEPIVDLVDVALSIRWQDGGRPRELAVTTTRLRRVQ